MKMAEADVIWTPVFPPEWNIEPGTHPGTCRIEQHGSHWQRTSGDRWMPATSLGMFGGHSTKDDPIKQLLAMFILFNTITVRDRVPVEVVHEAFLGIDEYRTAISPDAPGAEPRDEE